MKLVVPNRDSLSLNGCDNYDGADNYGCDDNDGDL